MTDHDSTSTRSDDLPLPGSWVIEVSVSPEWFAEQDSSLEPPVQQPPHTVSLDEGYVLIGRESMTRDVHPLVQADDDAGCSRRHADLSWIDGAWILRDLNSVNGTYLQRAGAEFPRSRSPRRCRSTRETPSTWARGRSSCCAASTDSAAG